MTKLEKTMSWGTRLQNGLGGTWFMYLYHVGAHKGYWLWLWFTSIYKKRGGVGGEVVGPSFLPKKNQRKRVAYQRFPFQIGHVTKEEGKNKCKKVGDVQVQKVDMVGKSRGGGRHWAKVVTWHGGGFWGAYKHGHGHTFIWRVYMGIWCWLIYDINSYLWVRPRGYNGLGQHMSN